MAKKKKEKGPAILGDVRSLIRANGSDGPPGGVVPLFFPKVRLLATAAAAPSGELDVQKIRGVIGLLRASNGVQWDEEESKFDIDPSSLAMLPLEYRQLVVASAARASMDPFVQASASIHAVAAAAPEDDEQKIKNAIGFMKDAGEFVLLYKRLMAGAKFKASWWGAQIDLTRDAATALATMLGDVKYLTASTAVASFIPHIALILVVITAAGTALKLWIEASNKGTNGVTIFFYMWVLPAVQAR
jgi:hypothetical protein